MQRRTHDSQALLLEPVGFIAEAACLLRLAVPIIGITVSRMLMGFADFLMVAPLGTDAVAALSPSTMFTFMVMCLGIGAATGIQTFVAQSLGRGRPTDAPAYAWQGLYIALTFAVIFGIPIALLMEPFWAWIGSPPPIRKLQIEYCSIEIWALAPCIICTSLESFFNGIQRPAVALRAILIALVVNLVGNYILIYGHFGFPRMGVAGAALATVFAWIVRAAMLAYAFLTGEMAAQYQSRAHRLFNHERMFQILRVGAPTALQWVLDLGAWFIFLSLIMQGFGTPTLAASNVGIQLMHVSFMPAIGVGIALCSQVAHAVGADRHDLAARRATVAMYLTAIYMGLIGVVFLLAGGPLTALISNDPAVIQIGAGVLIWAAIFQISDALCIIYINALRGAGDTRWPAIIVTLHCWSIFIAGGFAVARFAPSLGYHGPWLTCTLYIIVLGLVLRRRFTSGAWKKIRLFNHPEPAASELPIIETLVLPEIESASPATAQPAAAPLTGG